MNDHSNNSNSDTNAVFWAMFPGSNNAKNYQMSLNIWLQYTELQCMVIWGLVPYSKNILVEGVGKSRVWQIDFNWYTITLAKFNVRPIIKEIDTFLRFLQVSFNLLVFVVFCKESWIRVNKKLIPRVAYWKHQKQPREGIYLFKVFSSKVDKALKKKKLWKSPFFSKIASWKSRTLLILTSYKDILPRMFLKLWVISDNFLKF